MSLKKFLFFPVEEDGRTRQVVNGVVTSLNTPKALPQAPDGNQEIAIGWERSEVYKGNIRNFSLPLGFVGDGYKILANDSIKFTIDRKLWLLVKQLTYEWSDTTFKEYYKQLYKGQFDFSTGELDQGNYRFNINLMEGGLQRLLKANETTKFELPFDLQAKNIRMDGMFIQGSTTFLIPEDTFNNGKYVSMFVVSSGDPAPGIAFFDVLKNGAAASPNSDTLEYHGETVQDIDNVHITGVIPVIDAEDNDIKIELQIYNMITESLRLTIDLAPDEPYTYPVNIPVDETFDLLKGDRLFLRFGENPLSVIEVGEWQLKYEVVAKPESSVIPGFTLYDVGRKLVEKITGNPDDFDSTLLADMITNFGCEIILTSGDGVRGISNAALKTSWRDFYKFVDTMLMTEMTVTDKIRISDRLNAYQPPSVKASVPLGNIKNLKVTPAIDQMYTSVKVGHQDQDVNDTNGKFDFNGNMVFTFPIKSIPDKQMDLQTPYKASPYEIEQTRANFEGKTTTDKETDNDVFAIGVIPDAVTSVSTTSSFRADGTPFAPGEPFLSVATGVPEFREGMKIRVTGTALNNGDYTIKFATGWFFGQLITLNEPVVDEDVVATIEILEGQLYDLDRGITIDQLTDPDVSTEIKETVFNVRLSPKRILLRHSRWLAGMLWGYEAEKITYADANRNKDMIAGGVIEKADINISTLGVPMFIPKYFEFDAVSPVNMPEILEQDPNPVFDFVDPINDFDTYNGFFYRGGIALNDLEEQTFKLLATFENDLLPLIP